MAGSISISPEDVKSYISTFGVSALQKQILASKKRINLAELMSFASFITAELPELSDQTGFTQFFSKLKSSRAADVLKVWSTPAAYHWNAMVRPFIDVAIHQAPTPQALINYLAELGCSFEEGFAQHLHDLGRFLLAVKVLSEEAVKLDRPLKLTLPCTLPGTGIALLPAESLRAQIELDHLDQLLVTDLMTMRTSTESNVQGPISFETGTVTPVSVLKLPIWQGAYGTITSDNFEICLNLSYIEAYPRVHDSQQITRFATVQTQAIDRLARFNPALVDELSSVVSSVTIMDASGVDVAMASGSASAIFGACFFSLTDEPLYVAEMMLHEFSHNKLRLLQEFVDLSVPTGISQAVYYSPWRDDPRPLDGLLHGLFVFSTIARFWMHVLQDSLASPREQELARRRVATLLYQLRYAYDEFTEHARLTEYSKAFLEVIRASIEGLTIETTDWDFATIRPLFQGVLRDAGIKELPVAESLPQHRLLWETRYRQQV